MATFRVGQRVRFVLKSGLRPSQDSILRIGDVGTIVPHNGMVNDISGRLAEYHVRYDTCPHQYYGHDGWQLEPLYDGHSKVSWSECLWAPNKETA